jgi:hypothetical protein
VRRKGGLTPRFNDLHFRVELWDDREIHLVQIIAAASDATTARAAYGAAAEMRSKSVILLRHGAHVLARSRQQDG